jgi:hypothetical protein
MIGDNEYDRCNEYPSQVGYEQIYSLDMPPLHCYIVKTRARRKPAEKPSENRLDESQRHKIKAAGEVLGYFLLMCSFYERISILH